MIFSETEIGVRYIVTVGSYDGTFEIGDRILINKDGTITCIDAGGWIQLSDVAESILGMECVPDIKYCEKRIEKLSVELEKLTNIIGGK